MVLRLLEVIKSFLLSRARYLKVARNGSSGPVVSILNQFLVTPEIACGALFLLKPTQKNQNLHSKCLTESADLNLYRMLPTHGASSGLKSKQVHPDQITNKTLRKQSGVSRESNDLSFLFNKIICKSKSTQINHSISKQDFYSIIHNKIQFQVISPIIIINTRNS